ncbi:MAG: arylamine N-acetyltransferase [Rhodobiaceae bacterium]|nr:arylamine N-acetyltransferase [Rhodobiaceae bacterium]MCC0055831.1 arylamine N-acetyltransferase [Rhodobiaceae bacterium]
MPLLDISSYLERIGVNDVPLSVEGLSRLQSAQTRAIPFENIDPLLGSEPDVSSEAVFAKLLNGMRGGYCFELNRLYQSALDAFGFQPVRRLARVRMGAAEGGPRTHLAMVGTIDGTSYLTDAGFGGPGPISPLLLDEDAVQIAPNGQFRLWTDVVSGERVLSRLEGESEFPLYGFDNAYVGDPDIEAANFLCATWSGSPFPSHLMVNGYDGDTRIGLFDAHMTLESGGTSERREVSGATELRDVLRNRLGINIDPVQVERVWARITPAPGERMG